MLFERRFPLTPALSLREREKHCGAVLQVSAGLGNDGPSLFPLLGERVRVRGKGAHEFNSVMRRATWGVLSAHPGPLPWGEEPTWPVSLQAEAVGLFERLSTILPLPEGEG